MPETTFSPQTDAEIAAAARAVKGAAESIGALVNDLRGDARYGTMGGLIRNIARTTDVTIEAIGNVARDLRGSGEVTTGNALRAMLGRIGVRS